MLINVMVTAIDRPELHAITIKSFWEKLFEPALTCDSSMIFRFFINKDIITNTDKGWIILDEYLLDKNAALRPFTSNLYTDCIRSLPHFGRAFHNTWIMATKFPCDFYFYLEDDWLLTMPVDIKNMVKIMHKYPHLQILRLNAFPGRRLSTKNWNKYLPWNGVFYEVPAKQRGSIGFAGHPSLISPNFIKQTLPFLNPAKNPEKQLKGRNEPIAHLFKGDYLYGVYGGRSQLPIIQDLGRKWMVANGYHKEGNKAFFTNYRKKEAN